MSVNLQKGQKVDLTKSNPGLIKLMVGLGWDEAPQKKVGFFSAKPAAIDCDASVIVCDADGKLNSKSDLVYFANLTHDSGSITHMGDNLTGEGDGDDEQIMVDLQGIDKKYSKLVFVVNIYQAEQRKQHFGMISNAYIRIIDAKTNIELLKYNLSEGYENMTAMIFGEIYRHDGEWKFNAMGQATTDKSLTELIARYK